MTPTFIIPPEDLPEFAMLRVRDREYVARMFTALRVIHEAPSGKRVEAARQLSALANGERGFSAYCLLRRYNSYTATGAWRVILPARPKIRTEGKVVRVSRHLAAFIRRGCRN